MTSTSSVAELQFDLEEYESLFKLAKRPKVQGTLIKEIDYLRKELLNAESKKAQNSSEANGASNNEPVHGYLEKITNYAWDQSDKFLKLYMSLGNLSEIEEKNIVAEFTTRSVSVKVQFANKTSQLSIVRLCEDIIPGDSFTKKKSEYVLVMLKKSQSGKTWPSVTEREKKAKESKEKDKPKLDDNEDPSSGITSLLKNMYDDGDDEMKRTISKAFYESQTKQREGGEPSMPGL